MSFLEYWDHSLIERLDARSNLWQGFDVLRRASFVRSRGDRYEIHEVVADVLRNSMDFEDTKTLLCSNLNDALDGLRDDESLTEEDRMDLENHLLKSLSLLADVGVEGLNDEQRFNIYMRYAESAWTCGDLDSARRLYASTSRRFGGESCPTQEYLKARLKAAAIDTQYFLRTGNRKHHQHAIDETEAVLDLTRRFHPTNDALIKEIMNDLGVSYSRFKQYDKALEYQCPIVKDLFDKDSSLYTADEARYLNNYGSTCQQTADNGPGSECGYYETALDSYRRSYEARKRIFGDSSLPALISFTNEAVVSMRLGRLDEAEAMLKEAIRRFENAGFPEGKASYQRCWYQLAILERRRAQSTMENNAVEAATHLEQALSILKRVHRIQVLTTTPFAVGARKTADEMNLCENLLNGLRT